jgi:hypothetical protein
MADVEAALLEFLGDLAWTTTVTPGDLPTKIADFGGVLRIRRIGGGSDRDSDQPVVSVQAFAADTIDNPRATHDLAWAVENRFVEVLNGARAGYAAGVSFDDITKSSGPVELPYPYPAITVAESIYRLTIRR